MYLTLTRGFVQMPNQDVEFFQSFCRRWINRLVREHFRDVPGNDDSSLSTGIAREATKRICLHKDTDTMPLTLGRLLLWWVEARGLFNDILYGIPSTEFEIKHTYYPQVKLHFREDRYDAAVNKRRPARSEVSFRWREENFSTANVRTLATKILNDFARPPFKYKKGRQAWTYWDNQKGYRFTVYVTDEQEARDIIGQVIGIQDTGVPDWQTHLREHVSQQNFNTQEFVRVLGESVKKPKRRPVGTVEFQYAELFIPGLSRPLVLVDRTGTKPRALNIV